MKYFAALLLSAVLFVACGDESSSSAPAPDPSEESSSSLEKTTESSSSAKPTSSEDKQSSSSAKKDNSSSSAVKASSSSATPKSSSSEEVKQSSSSIVASSSSVAEQSSSSFVIPMDLNPGMSYSDLEDPRDSRTYKYFAVTGKDTSGKKVTINVMAQNLNVGVMVDGEKNQEDDSKIERYCYDNDSINCLIYGGLYQWAEMMQLPSRCNTESCADLIKPNHQGICPAGWRLLTYNDFYIVVHAEGNKNGVEDVRATAFGGYNYSGYSLIGAGARVDDATSKFTDLDDGAYWFFPTEQVTRVYRGGASFSSKSMKTFNNGYGPKLDGYSVRCVMVE
ncbi:FISUMP domain-containing protein [Fibrobacter sp. UWB10]|uniref:FISUMP domain-containing protein n=1 Tax=Fibrobacter sp. UWB10 TaxID=1896201 RepID=UPI0024033EBE|nr:FISUMP domain-containing protein [Fibrobacter sp. UWB10]SMP49641.1 major paralogous domain-containing protein [Fibrobacter sp. UWB10]